MRWRKGSSVALQLACAARRLARSLAVSSSYSLRRAPRALFALQLELQRVLVARPCAAASLRRASSSRARCSSPEPGWFANCWLCGVNGVAGEFGLAGLQAALGKSWLPGLGAPGRAAAHAPGCQAALLLPCTLVFQARRGAPGLSASCMSSSSKRPSAPTRRSCNSSSWASISSARSAADLARGARAPARPGLCQAQHLYLQGVVPGFGLAVASRTGGHQALHAASA
jgi:hypothetical protein